MTRRWILAIITVVAAQIAWPLAASAQTVPSHPWSRGTMLDVSIGGATASSAEARSTVGMALGWELNRWVSIEGSGLWLLDRHNDDAFAAELKATANLTRPQKVVPFVGAGVGLYRASFDPADGGLPDFYQRRLRESLFTTRQTFTDPTLVFGGGVNVFTSPHFSIRPDISVRVVTRNSETYAVTLAAVHVTYRFGFHDIG